MKNKNPKFKVGILTFHRSINYGAFYQSYSLSNRLKNDFNVEVEIVDFEYLKKNIWQKLIVFKRSQIKYAFKYLKQYLSFRKSLVDLPLSNKTFISQNEKKAIDYINENYDLIIVGSDAVWSYNSFKLGVENIYFLKGINIPKASYAACAFGLDFNNLPDAENDYVRDSLKSFEYLGVRDTSTYDYVNMLMENPPVFTNCDPTFLLDKPGKNLLEGVLKRHKISPNKKIIGIMIDNNLVTKRIKEEFGGEYQIISLFNHNPYADYFLNDLTPLEWSQIFQIFDILFTSYFHGSILGIRNHTPVISLQGYPYNEKYISKIEQVFLDLGLPEYCFIENNLDDNMLTNIISLANETLSNRAKVVERLKIGIESEKKKYTSFKEYIEMKINESKS